MERIGVRELRQHASRYLSMVKGGETVEITERGELVALLVSPHPAVVARDRLVASGLLTPAKAPFQLPVRRDLGDGKGQSASAALEDLRAERLP